MADVSRNCTAEASENVIEQEYKTDSASARARELQRRVDAILSGQAAGHGAPKPDRRLFAAFIASDKFAASALAAAWMNMADEEGGLDGLERAVNHMYESLEEDYPIGLVRHAATAFLTHYEPARRHLVVRNLEELQPGMTKPSSDFAAAHTRRRLIANM